MKRILSKVLPITLLVAILVTLPILAEERGNGDDALPDGIDILNEILDSMVGLRFDDEAAQLLHILEQLIQIREEDRLTLNRFEVTLLLPSPFEDPIMRERIHETLENLASANSIPASREGRLEHFMEREHDYREALFRDFVELALTAEVILDFSRSRELQFGVFTGFGSPRWDGGWYIGITDEAFLPIVWHMSSFVGIPMDAIVVGVGAERVLPNIPTHEIGYITDDGVMRFFCPDVLAYLSQYSHLHISEDGAVTHLKDAADGSLDVFELYNISINVYGTEERFDVERFGMALPMGMFLQIRTPNGGLIMTGTLGHPGDHLGMFAFTTNHGAVRPGDTVFAPAISANPIGTVVNWAFDPLHGLDVSLIRMDNGFTIWPFNPINGQRMSLFNIPPPLHALVRAFPLSGGLSWGELTNPSRTADIPFPGFGALRFHRMIETNISLSPNDSGAALLCVNANNVAGTLVGRTFSVIYGERTYFSNSGNYWHLVWPWFPPWMR